MLRTVPHLTFNLWYRILNRLNLWNIFNISQFRHFSTWNHNCFHPFCEALYGPRTHSAGCRGKKKNCFPSSMFASQGLPDLHQRLFQAKQIQQWSFMTIRFINHLHLYLPRLKGEHTLLLQRKSVEFTIFWKWLWALLWLEEAIYLPLNFPWHQRKIHFSLNNPSFIL